MVIVVTDQNITCRYNGSWTCADDATYGAQNVWTHAERIYNFVDAANDDIVARLDAATASVITTTNIANDNTWHYYSLIYGTAAQVTQSKVHVDNLAPVSITNASSALSTVSVNLAIGANLSGSGNTEQLYYAGLIDEVRISNEVRSPDWIKTEYNNQKSTKSFYLLDDTSLNEEPLIFFWTIP